jgi:hypothetical protein
VTKKTYQNVWPVAIVLPDITLLTAQSAEVAESPELTRYIEAGGLVELKKKGGKNDDAA